MEINCILPNKRKGSVTVRLKDIAADLGVSLITVSKVLRNKPDVGPETRRRVLQRVAELNYRPNLVARGLASGRSYTVGLVVPDITDSFFAEFAKSLGASLREQSYLLIVASADEKEEVERLEVENLLARGVDALMLASCRSNATSLKASLSSSVPFVLVDRTLPDLRAHFVGTNDRRAGQLATEHLLALGRVRVAHIGGNGISTSIERLHGYREALQANRMPVAEELISLSNLHEYPGDQIGRMASEKLLLLAKPPDAVFCYNDLIAVGVIKALGDKGLRVPDDVAVIGCGNLALSSYLEVPLSSVDQRTAKLGATAAKLVLGLIGGKSKLAFKRSLVEPKLIVRASTGDSSLVGRSAHSFERDGHIATGQT
jgi:LacI family transcriptional regulator